MTVAAVQVPHQSLIFVTSSSLTKRCSIFQSSDTNLRMIFTASETCCTIKDDGHIPSSYFLLHFFLLLLCLLHQSCSRDLSCVTANSLVLQNLSKLIYRIDGNASFHESANHFESINTLGHTLGFTLWMIFVVICYEHICNILFPALFNC